MTEAVQKRRLANYLVPAVVAVLAIVILWTSRWNAPDKYSPRAAFAGCYRDARGTTLELTSTGTIVSGGIAAGSYQIVSPVGGKHGYLVEAANVNLGMVGDRMVAQPGSGGFFWPVSSQGELTVTFAPDTRLILKKAARC